MSGLSSPREEVVCLNLDLGSYELGVGECRELIRLLHRRRERPDGAAADASARRLEALLYRRAGPSAGNMTEDELDAIANSAWDWLERVGPDTFPERVLLVLDVLRARHVHE
ncbi:MAG: hypothetical protein OEV29_05760 [Thermoleophilia bacterium]|nr:hypothetical protein [Thermoleophilia bacterium]MDH4340241.1 hypothetical protein [Thermoleophilia bacterium]